MRLKSLLVGTLLGLCPAAVLLAQQLPLDPTVRVGELPNGFRYFIKQNAYPEKRAVLYLANKVGSILETEEERGLAHFMEHMNFKGTKHFPKNELINYLEKSGVRFGADLNAYTSYDETIYQLPIPTDNAELWKNGMQIMRDWAAEATLDREEFEKERGVILEEKRLQQNAAGRMREQYMPSLYNHSRYAERAPIGLSEVIAKADIQVLSDFYSRWYRPDLQALIVVGDIDVDAVEQQIKALFGDLKSKAAANAVRPEYGIDLIDSLRVKQVKDKEYASAQIELFVKRKTSPVVDEDSFKRDLVRQLSNSLLAARFQEIARKGSLTYMGLQVSASDFVADLSLLNVRISIAPDKWEQGFKAAYTEVLRVKKHGFTAAELDDVKARLKAQIAMQEREKNKIASLRLVEDYLQYFLSKTAYLSTDKKIELTRCMLETVTTDDVKRYLSDFLNEKDQLWLMLGLDKADQPLPEQQQLKQWINDLGQQHIEPYVQERQLVRLMDSVPTAGKVVKENKDDALGLTSWTLSNGVQVWVKPTDFKNDEILFTAFSPGGSSLYADEDYYSAMNAPAFVVNSGVGTLDLNQLSQFLNARAVQVSPFIGEREEGVSGASIGKELETGLGLTHLYMSASRLDTARFRIIMDRSRTAISSRGFDPKRAFADTVGNILGNYHFRRQPSSLATLEQIKADRVKAIFDERFANAADFSFVFVGNFKLDSLRLLTEKYLGSLPSSPKREQARDLNIRVPEGKIRRDLHMGQGDKGTVQLVFSGKYAYSATNNIYMDALKAALELRLTERLRKQESGVYSPSVQLTKAKKPLGFYALVISFDCDPSREEDLIAAVREEWGKMRKEGISLEEWTKFMAEEQRAHELQEKSNQFWLGYLKGQLDKGEALDEFAGHNDRLAQVNLKKLNAYLRKILRQENEIIVTLKPEEK
ncbi:M16 family metallopeptidase [Sphingobacterium bambusae]|uniref:M16 family metallopeptidase n=1 Tax=Sphingobacterium bambusae TaxID=662858 RepID=A0ABW6BIJ6_9SPHI|nr:insulinase family protein [Sphingobacterium bambusae]WPL49075.1 insulinase family protein [Sphingobacterium bambusae]